MLRRFIGRQRLGKPTRQVGKFGRVGFVQQLNAGLTEGEPQSARINPAQQLERGRSDTLHQLVPVILGRRKLAAVIGDSINVLSGNWSDANSTGSISSRTATNTTINAALVGGIVRSGGGTYSGGGENFVRLLEDWKNNTLCIYGSMVQLYTSTQGVGAWTGTGNTYKAPLVSKFYWDPKFSDNTLVFQSGPPGNLQIAAYLQQQRWYQVY